MHDLFQGISSAIVEFATLASAVPATVRADCSLSIAYVSKRVKA